MLGSTATPMAKIPTWTSEPDVTNRQTDLDAVLRRIYDKYPTQTVGLEHSRRSVAPKPGKGADSARELKSKLAELRALTESLQESTRLRDELADLQAQVSELTRLRTALAEARMRAEKAGRDSR